MPLLGPMAAPFLSNFKGAVPAAPALASGFRLNQAAWWPFTPDRDRALAVTVRVLSSHGPVNRPGPRPYGAHDRP